MISYFSISREVLSLSLEFSYQTDLLISRIVKPPEEGPKLHVGLYPMCLNSTGPGGAFCREPGRPSVRPPGCSVLGLIA
jgi:hypothetical protein